MSEASQNEEMLEAVWSNDTKKLKELVKAGVNVNARNECGWTPLHYAVGGGHLEIVKLLLKSGADVNAKEKMRGLTPLQLAGFYPEVIKILTAAEQK